MQRFILLRLGQSMITLLAVSALVFALARLSGNPLNTMLPNEATDADYVRVAQLWGLDRPLHEQYFTFLTNALRGEFGQSFRWREFSAMELIADRFPATLQLAGLALLFSVAIAIPIGVLSAVKRDTALDHVGKVVALLGQSVPSFWLGIVLIWFFAVQLGILPVAGRGSIASVVLPVITLGWYQVAALMRLQRSAMLDVLDSEYVKFARIKGLKESAVIWKHAARNAAITPLTYFAIIAGSLVTGSVVVESVFSWPGVGLLVLDAVRGRDYQVVQAVVLVFAGVFLAINLLVDVLYAYLDPRIRYQ